MWMEILVFFKYFEIFFTIVPSITFPNTSYCIFVIGEYVFHSFFGGVPLHSYSTILHNMCANEWMVLMPLIKLFLFY